jgi:hypothetical protein
VRFDCCGNFRESQDYVRGEREKPATEEGTMKRQLPPAASRRERLGRFDTLKLVVLLAVRWRRIARSVEEGLSDARNVLGDSLVQAESKASLTELVGASRRAREVGLPSAFEDKLVARRLSRAARHASTALDAARGRRRRRHAWRRVFAVTVGVGVMAGSAYAAYKARSTSGSSSREETSLHRSESTGEA